jgi:anti-anti-sigma factor
MNVFARDFDEALVLKACGRLHSKTAPLLLNEVLPHTESGSKPVIIDLENLYSLNSAGYRSLHILATKLNDKNRKMVLSNCRPEVKDRLQCARLCDRVAIYASLDEALASLRDSSH